MLFLLVPVKAKVWEISGKRAWLPHDNATLARRLAAHPNFPRRMYKEQSVQVLRAMGKQPSRYALAKIRSLCRQVGAGAGADPDRPNGGESAGSPGEQRRLNRDCTCQRAAMAD